MAVRRPGLDLAVFLAAVAVIAVAANGLAALPSLRMRVDATRTRAYSLSPQTRELLSGLEGDWTIALILDSAQADPAVDRQVGEVLDRFREATPRISVVRIDPADPGSLDRYDELLARLRGGYGDRVGEWETAIGAGESALQAYAVFLQQEAGQLQVLLDRLEPDAPRREEVGQLLGVLALRVEQAEQVRQQLAESMRVDDRRPLPDYETARSILVAGLSTWAQELFAVGQMCDRWSREPGGGLLPRFGAARRAGHEAQAGELAAAADALRHLQDLPLGRIGRALEQGEAAIVIGPAGAAVIPSAQLFPRLSVRSEPGLVAFDRRFRGEQMISATIRSLLVAHMPLVVFVHAEPESLLSRRDGDVDLAGAASVLEASRIEVREWSVDGSARPPVDRGRTAVWIIVPSPARKGVETAAPELALLDAAARLLAEGEPVLLSFYPSVLPGLGRPDPWQRLAGELGVEVDTSRVVFESVRVGPDETSNERGQVLRDFPADHPIARALHGQPTYFALPVPIRTGAAEGARVDAIGTIEPSPGRWLESNWPVAARAVGELRPGAALEAPVPVLLAVERYNQLAQRPQRALVVGSGGWMLSYVADRAIGMGGDRVALEFPGNYELLLSSVAWLSGMDELIARSPVSRQVARLDGVTPEARRRWRWIALLGAPAGCLALGLLVWTVRRS